MGDGGKAARLLAVGIQLPQPCAKETFSNAAVDHAGAKAMMLSVAGYFYVVLIQRIVRNDCGRQVVLFVNEGYRLCLFNERRSGSL